MSSLPPAVATAIPEAFRSPTHLVARHVREGRGTRTALVTPDGPVLYGELDVLNRAGNALQALGLAPEQRVVLLMHDWERLLRGLPRRHQDWRSPDPGQHAAAAGRLPVHSQRLARRRGHRQRTADRRDSSGRASPALPETPHRLGRRPCRAALFRSPRGGRERGARRRGHAQGRTGLRPVQPRQHGYAERRDSPPARHGLHHRAGMRAACPE